jgi:solute carrier family 25 oxoglutarate transporter 11
VRIQLGTTGSPFSVAAGIIRNEGFGKLYTGLSAGLLRQATYTTTRLGVFNTLSERLVKANNDQPLPFLQKAAAGLTAGGIGAVVGSPADLSLIRMQTDGTLPPEKRRGYRNVGNALTTIVHEEGFAGLFTGVWPTAVRAMALNIGMLATNDQAKEMLAQAGVTGFANTLGGSAVAGFFASFFSLPFDYMKTQLQKMSKDPSTGKYPYSGMLDIFVKTLRNEGILKFYTGFLSYYVRIAPHAMSTLIFMDLIKRTGTLRCEWVFFQIHALIERRKHSWSLRSQRQVMGSEQLHIVIYKWSCPKASSSFKPAEVVLAPALDVDQWLTYLAVSAVVAFTVETRFVLGVHIRARAQRCQERRPHSMRWNE